MSNTPDMAEEKGCKWDASRLGPSQKEEQYRTWEASNVMGGLAHGYVLSVIGVRGCTPLADQLC